jgi:rhamnose utilization protein RhaD (predicted bifunctional aldolase and dehydrogenase)/NAD(P)-dependent dehydrogenase (short-subunit alcohol dehydrogenase family)
MKSKWNSEDSDKLGNDLLKLRVYTSQLLGKEEDLVLHGGGNTSVKIKETNIFSEEEEIIYVKGSGWDLATIEEAGFAPVKLKTLQKMAHLDQLNDVEMVKYQRMAMTNPSAPNPSVEAILHAIIPFTFVDHTHADAIVTISNTINGKERIEDIYGENMLIVPYVMPGFLLAKHIFQMTRNIDWNKIEGMILLNHGVFTFHDNARMSYQKMIETVTKAEDYLSKHTTKLEGLSRGKVSSLKIAKLRQNVSRLWGKPILAHLNNSEQNMAFSILPDLATVVDQGPLTPDHIIRTKRTPVVLSDDDHEDDINRYATEYKNYFNEFNTAGELISLDHAPRWAIWPGHGTLSFGTSIKNINIIDDISRHTMKAIFQAGQLGGWHTLSKRDLFEMEYWVLEQEKLKKDSVSKPLQGKISLVTGAASGIGKACVQKLIEEGAVVAAIDKSESINSCFSQKEVLSIVCDITDKKQLIAAIEKTVAHFGGIDMLVSNAGIFPKSYSIEDMHEETWKKSMDINLTSHLHLLKLSRPYLSLGIDPAIVIIGSKNVSAPGPGASAYSVAKAGLTQLGRIAALEFGAQGIRVNILHPNAVFDTGIWTKEILEARAGYYGLTVEKYKTNNILKVEITSKDVAEIAVKMLGKTFSKVTGAQIPIDGGNERTI